MSPLRRTAGCSKQCAIILAGLVLASLAEAGTILYSTDGTATPGYDSGAGYGSYAGSNSTAALFTASASGTLDDIVVAASSVGNGTFAESIELRQDNSGTPGTVIDTFSVTFPNSPALVTGTSTSNPSIVSGQSYWLEEAIPPSAVAAWFVASPAVSGTVRASTTNDGPWQATCPQCNGDLPAFALIAQTATVPEPSTVELSLGALLLMMAMRMRCRRRI